VGAAKLPRNRTGDQRDLAHYLTGEFFCAPSVSALTHRATKDDSPKRSIGSLETVIRRGLHRASPNSLPSNGPYIKLNLVKPFVSCLSLVLCAAAACGGSSGTGGSGGTAVERQSVYTLSCTIGELTLMFPIELAYSVEPPYTAGGSSILTFSPVLIFDESTSSALSDAGQPKIDIISLEIASWALGATPSTIETSLAAAPINDFDVEIDTNDNGIPGPHRLELESVSVASSATEGAEKVELGIALDGLSMVLGEFRVPADCVDPTLVGFSASFDVGP